jgi:transcriptional regulator with XRE-family HTH domain
MPKKAFLSRPKPAVVVRAEEQVERLKREVQGEIRRQGFSQRELSSALGLGDTYLGSLFRPARGREPVGLRVDTLLALLELLQIPPSAAFAALESDEAPRGPFERPFEVGPKGRAGKSEAIELSEADLDPPLEAIEDFLRRMRETMTELEQQAVSVRQRLSRRAP